MKTRLTDLAIFGGPAVFREPRQFGQMNLPDWDRVKTIFSGIFERHYFSNHGILAQALEERLCEYLGVRNAVTLTNGTIALMHTAVALRLKGKVVTPAFTHPATVQALYWAGLQPIFCDVDPESFLITPDLAKPLIKHADVSAILAVHLFGNICDIIGFDSLSSSFGVPVFYDAAHAFGCRGGDRPVGSAGRAEIFSMNAAHVLNAAEGGVVCTDDDELAITVRNLRSSYGRRKVVPIPVKANGRFSEFQAGLALLSLDDYAKNHAHNQACLCKYADGLQDVDGVSLKLPDNCNGHNYEHVVLMINEQRFGISRDILARLLSAENVGLNNHFTRGVHQLPPFNTHLPQKAGFPVTEKIAAGILRAPSGQQVAEKDIERLCEVIAYIQENAQDIKTKLRKL